MDFHHEIKQAVVDYYNSTKDVSSPELTKDDVYIVWFVKALQNFKGLASTKIPDNMYYELTYNGMTGELYLDAYKKFQNVTFQIGMA